jgi:alkylated DNA repair dioxygenase AlkB
MSQADLFEDPAELLPPGLKFHPQLIDLVEADQLSRRLGELPFKPFEFHGYTGKRRVVSFGWSYDFELKRLTQTAPLPDFLMPLRREAAGFATLNEESLEQVLVTQYQPGAAIGWHKDKAVFDEVVGVSFGAICTMRFRRPKGTGWERRNVLLPPGSAYLITGPARTDWEHSIPPLEALRYSVTFRSLQVEKTSQGAI